jgi:hypothetical protein
VNCRFVSFVCLVLLIPVALPLAGLGLALRLAGSALLWLSAWYVEGVDFVDRLLSGGVTHKE